MKYFLVLLAFVAVFADPRSDSSSEDSQQEVDKPFYESQPEVDESFDESQEVEKSFDDSQQEIGTLNIENDDDGNQQAVIPTSTHLCSINVPALMRLIYRVINRKLASQPGKSYNKYIYLYIHENTVPVHILNVVVQMLYLSIGAGRRVLSIRKIRGGIFTLGPVLNRITIGNGQTAITSSILAYRPRYNGFHQTRLGAVFLNLERLFPCAGKTGLVPVCRRFTQEEDGFFKGRTITEAADIGNNMRIFGRDIKTYGFVFERCSILSGRVSCLPNHFQTVVTCFLPRSCL